MEMKCKHAIRLFVFIAVTLFFTQTIHADCYKISEKNHRKCVRQSRKHLKRIEGIKKVALKKKLVTAYALCDKEQTKVLAKCKERWPEVKKKWNEIQDLKKNGYNRYWERCVRDNDNNHGIANCMAKLETRLEKSLDRKEKVLIKMITE